MKRTQFPSYKRSRLLRVLRKPPPQEKPASFGTQVEVRTAKTCRSTFRASCPASQKICNSKRMTFCSSLTARRKPLRYAPPKPWFKLALDWQFTGEPRIPPDAVSDLASFPPLPLSISKRYETRSQRFRRP